MANRFSTLTGDLGTNRNYFAEPMRYRPGPTGNIAGDQG
jgi:hypothetical protein